MVEGMAMIESIEFKNFKALRDATLPLGPLTILIGPNGSGKSTVLQALNEIRHGFCINEYDKLLSFSVKHISNIKVSLLITFDNFSPPLRYKLFRPCCIEEETGLEKGNLQDLPKVQQIIDRFRIYSLDSHKIAAMATIKGITELGSDGTGLAAVLDGIRDVGPEQFKAIENQISLWMPEFDPVILFDCPKEGCKTIALRTKDGQHKVPASDLSQGTLIALALLTLAYHPTPPSLVALEEPDRGLHPYLLRRVKDALVRLAYPESCGENRPPVQVIATTHSPYFVDLFRETPECIVVANKVGLDVKFERLTDQPKLHDIIGEAALGDAWFSGVLGGVPSGS
jgi:predicted ATPase